MKAEQHPLYLNTISNTTWERYYDYGRWEMMRGLIDNDPAWLRRSFEEMKRDTANFTLLQQGHMLGELLGEFALMYIELEVVMSPEEKAVFADWLKAGVALGLENHRVFDSDEDCGIYVGCDAVDRALGTAYTQGAYHDATTGTMQPMSKIREVLRFYVEALAKGGTWCESSQYNYGTMYLFLQGCWVAGLDKYPELTVFLPDLARDMMFDLTPDLKDRWQWGDDEGPHDISLYYHFSQIQALVQFLLREIGRHDIAEAMRQFELEVYEANVDVPFSNVARTPVGMVVRPLFARYTYWHDPYAATRPWKPVAGKFFVSPGQGHVKWNDGDHSGHIYFTGFKNGIVDHSETHIFGDLKLFKKDHPVLWHPIGYAHDVLFNNFCLSAMKYKPSQESTGFVAADHIPGEMVYAAGVSAGFPYLWDGAYAVGYDNFHHETSRHVFALLDGPDSVTVVFDRIHMNDPKAEANWPTYNAYLKGLIEKLPTGKRWAWHMPVQPTVVGSVIRWPGVRIERAYSTIPLSDRIIDEMHEASIDPSTIADSERKWAVWSDPTAWQDFTIVAHGITDNDAVIFEQVTKQDVVGIIVRRPGKDPVTCVISAKPGPRIPVTLGGQWGASIIFDKTALNKVVAARRLTAIPDLPGKVFIADMGEKLVISNNGQVPVPVPPVPPEPEPVPVPVPVPTPPVPPVRITVEKYDDKVKPGGQVTAMFRLEIPADGRKIVEIWMELGDKRTTVTATDGNAIAAVRVTAPTKTGTYVLNLGVKDSLGTTDRTGRPRSVEVK
jgi:hypothetical protein